MQPKKKILALTNRIVLVPQLPYYDSEVHPAPSVRNMLANVLNANPDTALEPRR